MGGVPQRWQKYGQVTVSLDQQVKHSGNQSVKIVSSINNRSVGIKQTVSVTGGDRYEFSVWAKGENLSRDGGDVVSGGIQIPGQKSPLYINMGKVRKKTEWIRFTKKIQVPPGVSQITISLFICYSTGTAWFDEAQLRNLSSSAQKPSYPNTGKITKNASEASSQKKKLLNSLQPDEWRPGLPDIVVCNNPSQWQIEKTAGVKTKLDPETTQPDGTQTLKISIDSPICWSTVSILPPKPVTIKVPGGRLQYWFRAGLGKGPFGKVFIVITDASGEEHRLVARKVAYEHPDLRHFWVAFASRGQPQKNIELKYPIKLERIDIVCKEKSQRDFWLGTAEVSLKGIWFQHFFYGKDYISPDLESTPFFFGLDWAFGHKEYPRKVYLNLELPQDIELANWRTRTWGDNTDRCKLEKFPSTREGKKYTRYRIAYPPDRYSIAHFYYQGIKRVFYYLKTDLEKGTRNAYYYLEIDDHNEPATKLPLEVIRIKKVPAPKKLLTAMDSSHHWPGVFSNLKHLGITLTCLGNENELTKQITGECRANGITPIISASVGGSGHLIKSLLSYKAQGATEMTGAISERVPCLLKAHEKMPYVINSRKILIDKELTTLMFDDEFWDTIQCFCPDCLAGFKEFKKKYGKELPDMDPVEFCLIYQDTDHEPWHKVTARDSKANPSDIEKLYYLWISYHYSNYSKAAGLLRKGLQEYATKKGIPYPVEFFDCWGQSTCDKLTARVAAKEAFSYLGYADYDQNPKKCGDSVAVYAKWIKGSGAKLKWTLWSGGCYCDLQNYQPRSITRWMVLESFAAGADGIYMYYFGDIDLADMKEYSRAIWTVLPVEDIIVEGRRAEKDIKITKGEANVRALKREDDWRQMGVLLDSTILKLYNVNE